MSTAVQEAPRVVQLWEGDGEEPFALKRARQEAEVYAAQRESRVQARIYKRKKKFEARNKSTLRGKQKRPLIRCHRFEMSTMDLPDGRKQVHLHVITDWHPEDMDILPGDRRQTMTVRYPMWDDPRDRFRRPVAMEFTKPEVTQFRVLEKGVEEDVSEIYQIETRPWEYSITLRYTKVNDRSKKAFKAFREAICQPV